MEKLANSDASLAKSHEVMQIVHSRFIIEIRTNFQNQGAQIQSLETQVGQFAQMLSKRLHGNFPNTSEANPRREGKEQCQVITVRSGKIVKEPAAKESKSKDGQNNKLIEKTHKT